MDKTGAEKYAHLLDKNLEVIQIIKKEGTKWKDISIELEKKTVKE